MSRFWIIWCGAFSGTLAAIVILPLILPPPYRSQPLPWEHLVAGYSLAITLTTLAWAICFREQIERRRLSLFAILALISSLAILFAFIKNVRSFG